MIDYGPIRDGIRESAKVLTDRIKWFEEWWGRNAKQAVAITVPGWSIKMARHGKEWKLEFLREGDIEWREAISGYLDAKIAVIYNTPLLIPEIKKQMLVTRDRINIAVAEFDKFKESLDENQSVLHP